MGSEAITRTDLMNILNEVLPIDDGTPTTEPWVNLATYTSNLYTFPTDGYVFTYNASNTSSYVSIFGNNGDDGTGTIAIGAQNSRMSVFVKKGMKCKVTGTFNAVRFTPLKYI